MRAAWVITVGVVAGLAVPGAAFAHVEVSADKTTAGATDVTLTFTGEAENPAAGIKSERVVLPQGIDPASVTPVKTPGGWSFTRAADGFTVGGTALKTGIDAVWAVRIAKLPDGQTRLSFKTLETYGNGDVSRWIEIQQPGQAEPDNPAPLVTLKAAASTGPASTAPASTAPADVPSSAPDSATPTIVVTSAPAPAAKSDSHWWIWVLVAALLLILVVLTAVRARRSRSKD